MRRIATNPLPRPGRRPLAALVAAAALLIAGCAAPGPRRPARISHVVFFTLRDPGDAPALVADCDELLRGIPGVVSYAAGTHLDTGRGERVDDDYDVGLYVGFDTVEAYEGYVRHPDHVALVERWRPRITTLLVRDVLDATPSR